MHKLPKFLVNLSILLVFGLEGGLSSAPSSLSASTTHTPQKPLYLRSAEYAIGQALADSYEAKKAQEGIEKAWGPAFKFIYEGNRLKDIIYLPLGKSSGSVPNREKIRQKECAHFLEIAKREMFPFYEKLIYACEEYAGYFLFWEAYYYSNSDVGKAKKLLEETAVLYPEATPGKVANSIPERAKSEGELVSLIQQEFQKLNNPVESYKRKKGEPENSVMNNLKEAIASTRQYKRWKDVFYLGEYGDLPQGKARTLARENIKLIIDALDGAICSYYDVMASACLTAPDRDINLFKHYLNLIISRYPDTSYAVSAKRKIDLFAKPPAR